MTCRRRSRMLRLAAAVALGLMARTASAQEEPIVIGLRKQTPTFHIQRPEVVLQLIGRYSTNTFNQADSSQKVTETLFQEILGLSTTGHILHPNIVDLRLKGAFGLMQSNVDGVGIDDGRSEGTVHEYDVGATIMRRSMAPLDLNATRNVELINRPFAQTLESTTESYGATWSLNLPTAPTTFRYFHADQQQTALDGTDDFRFKQDTFDWRTQFLLGPNQTLDWEYTFNSIERSVTENQMAMEDTHSAGLRHELRFGKDKRSRLSSNLTYFSQDGDFQQERLRLDETLTLRHSDTFETWYNYQFQQFTFEDTEQTSHRAAAGFRHRLYESLTTSGRIGALQFDVDDSSTSEQFADLNFDYRKKVPLGRLSSNLLLGINRQQNDSRSDTIHIVDEARLFTDGQPIEIVQRNIVASSVRITDAAGLRIYRPDRDYLVRSLPDRVELRRIIGGAIPSGSTVLVDYDIAAEAASDIATDTFSIGTRYDFDRSFLKGLSLYVRYLAQNQTIDTDAAAGFTPNDVRDVTFGAEYRIWNFIFLAERQLHDSTVVPHDTTRLSAQYLQNLGADTTVSLGAFQTIIDYKDLENTAETTTLSATIEHRITRNLRATASVSWIHQTDSFQNTTGFDETFALRWNYRQTSVFALVRNTTLETDEQDNSFFLFQVGLERKF